MKTPRVALVHDWLTTFAGAEQVLLALHELFPEAPIYTSIWDPERSGVFKDADVRTTYLQRIPTATKRHQVLIPLMPQAFESLDLNDFDVIISSSTGMAKGVIVQPHQVHICYCHTPPRYLWRLAGDTRNEGRFDSWLRSYVSHKLRLWDVVSSERVDSFVANSQTVAARIKKIYRRDASVVYPPVHTDRFQPVERPSTDYFLSASRLIAYKRLDVIIEACKRAKQPLRIVGEGPEGAALRKLAEGAPWIQFCGRLPDTELAVMYANAKAFVFAAEEDFGIVPVEAMSAGRPVIAYGKGGLTESVKPGITGEFFREQTAESLAATLRSFDAEAYLPADIRKHAQSFDTAVFKKQILSLVNDAWHGKMAKSK